jgi:hypothetical protein
VTVDELQELIVDEVSEDGFVSGYQVVVLIPDDDMVKQVPVSRAVIHPKHGTLELMVM